MDGDVGLVGFGRWEGCGSIVFRGKARIKVVKETI
jgi:hypothetical protein